MCGVCVCVSLRFPNSTRLRFPRLHTFFVLGTLFVKTQVKPSTKTNPAGRPNGLNWAGFCAALKVTLTPKNKSQGCSTLSGKGHYCYCGLVHRPCVWYSKQAVRIPNVLSVVSVLVFFSGMRSLQFNQCMVVRTDLSSDFFLRLLTPIDFRWFSVRSNHLNFRLPAFLLPSGFPRSTLLMVPPSYTWSAPSGVPRNSVRGGGSTNSVEDRGQRKRGSGGGSPLVRGSWGSCNLVQEISFLIVKFS